MMYTDWPYFKSVKIIWIIVRMDVKSGVFVEGNHRHCPQDNRMVFNSWEQLKPKMIMYPENRCNLATLQTIHMTTSSFYRHHTSVLSPSVASYQVQQLCSDSIHYNRILLLTVIMMVLLAWATITSRFWIAKIGRLPSVMNIGSLGSCRIVFQQCPCREQGGMGVSSVTFSESVSGKMKT